MNQEISEVTDETQAGKKSIVREYFESFIIAIVLALFIRTFVVQAFKIPTGSMKNTLLVGDHILVNKFVYGLTVPFVDVKLLKFSKPKREDVIVFKYPKDESKDYIKRVIGLPGDEVRIVDKKVFINGLPLNGQDYARFADRNVYSRSMEPDKRRIIRDQLKETIVPEGSYFVLGDNRDNSEDSRFWGYVPEDNILGKAFMIYFSWDGKDHSILPWGWIRFGRIGDIIR